MGDNDYDSIRYFPNLINNVSKFNSNLNGLKYLKVDKVN